MRVSKLIALARAAAPAVTVKAGVFGTDIRRGSVAIRIWNDGKPTRIDCRMDLVTNMTLADAAKALGLKETA